MINSSYTVAGMTCAHCVRSVSEAVSAIEGVKEVSIDLDSGVVTVTSAESVGAGQVRAAIEEAGYQVAETAPRA
jgi:copper ion binding protein